MTFEKFYYLNEAKFSEHSKNVREMDLPMFTVYVSEDLYIYDKDFRLYMEMAHDLLKSAFAEARKRISKMGFPSMHANVIFENYSINGMETSLGYAMGNPRKSTTRRHQLSKYMSLNHRLIYGILTNEDKYMEPLINTIVHEWAHLWMFNYGRRLSSAVQKLYDNIRDSQEDILMTSMMGKDFEKDYNDLMKYIHQFGIVAIGKGRLDVARFYDLFDSFEKKYNIPSFQLGNIKSEIKYELQQLVGTKDFNTWNSYIDQLDLKSTFDRIYQTSLMLSGLTGNKNAWDEKLADMVKWSRGYGMKNIDELWATGVEDFSKLPKEHQKRILALMSETY